MLVLLFVAYQLWGTSLYTARAQDDLKAEFDAKTAEFEATTGPAQPVQTPTTTTTVAAAVPAPRPSSGEPVAAIRIPQIGVEHVVVEGVSPADLRKGPGHYPSTPLPGEAGNAAIAGHRTTYGAPFHRLDELAPGDEIQVTTVQRTFTYQVTEKKIVRPEDVEVLDPSADHRLTLTTCHPKYSAAQRLIIVAGLAPHETPVPAPPSLEAGGPPPPQPVGAKDSGSRADLELADAGLSSGQSKLPAVAWGLVTALVGAAWWWATRRRRHWTTYLAGVPPFLAVLFVFYSRLEILLPASF